MSRKSSFARTYEIACALFLLLSSTAWAAVVNVHVNVPIVHPKVPVVNVKPNVPKIVVTSGSGSQIGGQSNGAGAGKVKLNGLHITRKMDTASPSFFKNATSGTTKATLASSCKVCGVTGASGGGNKSETVGGSKSEIVGVPLNPLGLRGDIDHPIVIGSVWNGLSRIVGFTGPLGGNLNIVSPLASGGATYTATVNWGDASPYGNIIGIGPPVTFSGAGLVGGNAPYTATINWGDAGPAGGNLNIVGPLGSGGATWTGVGDGGGATYTAGPLTINGTGVGNPNVTVTSPTVPLNVGGNVVGGERVENLSGAGPAGSNAAANAGEVSAGGGAIGGK